MIRICLKCNAYYADDSLAFCLVDGTPLLSLDPSNENWSEGVRAIQEKENKIRRQKRIQKWRRVMMSVMASMIVIMVVVVVVANSLIYLTPKQDDSVPATPVITSTTPERKAETPTPTPTPTLSLAPSPSLECSEADKIRELNAIKSKYSDVWKQSANADLPKLKKEPPPGEIDADVILRPFDIKSSLKTCTKASITVTYVWQVRSSFNGKPKTRTVVKKKQYSYVKTGGMWRPS